MVVGRGAIARLAADLAGVTDKDRAVDVGCGPGTAVREAARRGARAVGVDPAPVMLRLARTLTRGAADITWSEGAAEALPLADGWATVLWSISTVHHWPDIDPGLAEARRVLAPGGRLLIGERRSPPGAKGLASHGWTEDQALAFAERCRAAGFDDVAHERCATGRHRLHVVRAVRR